MKFCENPNCEFHIEVEENKRVIYNINSRYSPLSIIREVKPKGITLLKVKKMENHMYCKNDRSVIFFCDNCHLVIQAYLSLMSK